MGTNVYGSYKDVMGKLNARPFFNYTVAVNNDTTYSLNIYAGNEVHNKTKEFVPSMQGLGNFAISGTGQTTKSALNGYPQVAASGNAYAAIFTLFTWTWTKGTSAATKTITATDGYTGSQASLSFTVPVKTHYTVSYNANGGSGAPGSQTKWYGTNLTLSSTKPTRTGYTFSGWNTNSSGTGTNYASGGTYTGNAALTLYAKWSIIKYTISYNANGGSGAPASQTKTYGVNLILSSTVPTRTGYTFTGWKASNGTNYAKGGTYSANAATTLSAQWSIITYAVSYNANGGTGAPGNQTKTYGQTLTLSSTVPTRTGYTFNGWNTKSDGSGTNYAKGGSYTGNAALTLYARWTANTYTVVYNSNAPSGRTASGTTANSSHTYDAAKNLTTNGYTVPDYVFTGWATSATGAVVYTNGQSVKNIATSGTKNLYAVWRYAYTRPMINSVSASRYSGNREDDTGVDAKAFPNVTPGYVEDDSFQKTMIETRVYVQARPNGDTTWPTIDSSTTGYQIVDDTTGTDDLTFTISPPTGELEFGTDTQYDIRVVAIVWVDDDNKAQNTRDTFISKANFVLDVNADGTAVGILTAVSDDAEGVFIGKEVYMEVDTISGTDELYAAIVALGWESEVIS